METVGHRYLNRPDSENHPAQDSKPGIAAQLVKPATVVRGDKWNEGVATEEQFCRCGVVSVSSPPDSMESNWTRIQEATKRAGFENYGEYLLSDHWKLLRQSKLAERRSCCVCFANKPLAVHHIDYRAILDVALGDLAVLCMDCHDIFHMACRKKRIDYIGVQIPDIVKIVTEFRQTEWCKRWIGRRERRKLWPRKTNPNLTPEAAFKKACRHCRSQKLSVPSLQRMIALCSELIAAKNEPF